MKRFPYNSSLSVWQGILPLVLSSRGLQIKTLLPHSRNSRLFFETSMIAKVLNFRVR